EVTQVFGRDGAVGSREVVVQRNRDTLGGPGRREDRVVEDDVRRDTTRQRRQRLGFQVRKRNDRLVDGDAGCFLDLCVELGPRLVGSPLIEPQIERRGRQRRYECCRLLPRTTGECRAADAGGSQRTTR